MRTRIRFLTVWLLIMLWVCTPAAFATISGEDLGGAGAALQKITDFVDGTFGTVVALLVVALVGVYAAAERGRGILKMAVPAVIIIALILNAQAILTTLGFTTAVM